MYYGNIKKIDIANGEGVRTSLFVSGCKNHCKNCFNPETWSFTYGKPFTDDTLNELMDSLKPDYIKGLTILGGEPFELENQEVVSNIVKRFKELYPEKTLWMYSGYLFDQDLLPENGKRHTPFTFDILKNVDVLVDGRFVEELKNLSLKFRGSENQRIILVKESIKKGEVVLSPLNAYTNFKPKEN